MSGKKVYGFYSFENDIILDPLWEVARVPLQH